MKIILTTESELKELIKKATRKVLPTVIREAARKKWLSTEDVMEYLIRGRVSSGVFALMAGLGVSVGWFY